MPGNTKTRKSGEEVPLKNLLVTGGCGFIGSNFVNYFVRTYPDVHLFNIDKLDYCANLKSVEVSHCENYHFIRGDICNSDLIMHILTTHKIDTILHFAASSHVDNSFGNSMSFTRNNVMGTHNLLECARVYGNIEKFVHVSTDEVYGEVTSSQTESGVLQPTNPYAATKAAAELLAMSYHRSFNLPVVVTRGNNVYGKYQYPEKVIPRFAFLLSIDKPLTIQGSGQQSRTFVHVDDVVKGFEVVLHKAELGEIYNLGTQDEFTINEIAHRILSIVKPDEKDTSKWITAVRDRDFNDTRYDVHSGKLQALGWAPTISFDKGLEETVNWYTKDAFPSQFWDHINLDIQTSDKKHPSSENI